MNKNLKIILNSLEKKISLEQIKFSSNFTKFILEDKDIKDLKIKNGDFLEAKIVNNRFSNSKFIDCSFNNTSFKNCSFFNCEFKTCKFEKSDFFNIKFKDCNFYTSSIYETTISSVVIEQSNLEKNDFFNLELNMIDFENSCVRDNYLCSSSGRAVQFINCESENNIIEFNTISKATVKNNRIIKSVFLENVFQELEWTENSFVKTNMIKNKGVSDHLLEEISISGGRTKTLLSLFLANKIILSTIVILSTLFLTLILSILISNNCIYFRYIISEIWEDPYRVDIARELKVIYDVSLKERYLRTNINQAISFKLMNDKDKSLVFFKKAIKEFSGSVDIELYFWITYEIYQISENEKEWMKSWNLIERSLPDQYKQKVRLSVLPLLEKRYFSESILEIIREVLIKAEGNIETLIKLNNIVDKINTSYVVFKPKAYQIVRSFAKRKIVAKDQHLDSYRYIYENADEWINHYKSISNNR